MDVLISRRSEQLKEQVKLDSHLRLLSTRCPQQVTDYFLLRRVINRKQYEQIREGGLINAYSNINTNIDELDTDQKTMLNMLEASHSVPLATVCENLKQYNRVLFAKGMNN